MAQSGSPKKKRILTFVNKSAQLQPQDNMDADNFDGAEDIYDNNDYSDYDSQDSFIDDSEVQVQNGVVDEIKDDFVEDMVQDSDGSQQNGEELDLVQDDSMEEEEEEQEEILQSPTLVQAEEIEDTTDEVSEENEGLNIPVPASTRVVRGNEVPEIPTIVEEEEQEEAVVVDPTMPISSSLVEEDEELSEIQVLTEEEEEEEEVVDDGSLLPSLPLGVASIQEEQIVPTPEIEQLQNPLLVTAPIQTGDDEEAEEVVSSNAGLAQVTDTEIRRQISTGVTPTISQPPTEELPTLDVSGTTFPQRRGIGQSQVTSGVSLPSQDQISSPPSTLGDAEDEVEEELPIPSLVRSPASQVRSNQFPAPAVLIPSPRAVVQEEDEEEVQDPTIQATPLVTEDEEEDEEEVVQDPTIQVTPLTAEDEEEEDEEEIVPESPLTRRRVPSPQVTPRPVRASAALVDPTAPSGSLSTVIQEELELPPQVDFIFEDREVLPLKSKPLILPLVEPLVEEFVEDQMFAPSQPINRVVSGTTYEVVQEDAVTIDESKDDEDTSPKEPEVAVGSDEFFHGVLSQIMRLPPSVQTSPVPSPSQVVQPSIQTSPVLSSPVPSPSPVVEPPTQTVLPSPTSRSTVSSSSSVSIGALAPTPTATPTPAKPPLQTSQSSDDSGECVDIPPKGTILTCKEQYEFGKCGRDWMKAGNYCAKTCGYCPTGCTNIQPNGQYTCDQQALFGKCSEEWLQVGGYCQASCGVCGNRVVDETAVLQSLGHCVDIQPKGEHTCEQQKKFGKCDAEWMVANNYCQQTCNRCDS
eukprot:TRINITY_DN454_c0_g1_i12.p1 TRINITY_DN454_c0_g1~~TRINITY_DN454_c0_g1_i12.p1  ORF type:complete len:862 (-),score=243.24 TRINITY_DN454_c0_g1_i12:731-3139(-)